MVRRNLGLPHRLISKNFNCVIWVKKHEPPTRPDAQSQRLAATRNGEGERAGTIRFPENPLQDNAKNRASVRH